jgi:peroxiredoxin Q/BCP
MRSSWTMMIAVTLLPTLLAAQQPTMPKVGDTAPDFTLAAGTRTGISATPVHLSDLRGHTVVLAFYPRQRSSGCTIQMTHYRDAYDSIFHGGNGVTLLSISTDSVKDIASWAADSGFQWSFLSDVNAMAGHEYATMYPGRNMERRVVFVIAPDGKISYVMNPFNEIDATAYQQLTAAINDARSRKSE